MSTSSLSIFGSLGVSVGILLPVDAGWVLATLPGWTGHRARSGEPAAVGRHAPTAVHADDVVVHALNERFVELGGNDSVPSADDDVPGEGLVR